MTKISTRIRNRLMFLFVLRNKIFSKFTNKKNCEILMILGYQRSGTNALFKSFKKDTRYAFHNESNYSEMMESWALRPEKEIRYFLNKEAKIVTKPISESYLRTTRELFEEYKGYDVRYVLIIRDIVNIYYSNNEHDRDYYDNDIDKFVSLYNERMSLTLIGLEDRDGLVIRYEDVIDNPEFYFKVCDYLGITGNHIFRKDSNLGNKNLSEAELNTIEKGTSEIKEQLDVLVEQSKAKLAE